MLVFAENTQTTVTSNTVEKIVESAGLIDLYTLIITSGTKKVYITALTCGTETMAKIGFADIQVQRRTNGTSGWVTEFTPDDDIVTSAASQTKNNESRTVTGGYYYRVVLTHYVKETGWFFPNSQCIMNYSNVVWISKS